MARYNVHPAQGGGKYHDMKIYKDRQPKALTHEEQKRLKRLKKKRRKGAIGWPSMKAEGLDRWSGHIKAN